MSDPSPLLTDLYELSMLDAYAADGMDDIAVFELFFRALPPGRGFLVAAGLEQAVEFLETLRFGADELDWLRATARFDRTFIDSLAAFRFTGDVDAMPEGTVFFADEPVLRVTAPLPQAQLVETRLLNLIHFQTVIASKAARMVLAAGGRQLVDFGLRRAHGAEAGLLAARAGYLAGFDGTATVAAGRAFGIPLFGTMAHAFVQAYADEATAFRHFARSRPAGLTLLIDTYDTEAAARLVAALAPRLAAEGVTIAAVRIDSGDLGAHARAVRGILDAAGCAAIRIFASGGLDEAKIASLAGAPIDGYGVGTALATAADAPALDCAYKLQEYAGLPRRKRSEGKATWPGRKRVVRRHGPGGTIEADTIARLDEAVPGEDLLRPAMRGGSRVAGLPGLEAARGHARRALARLPEALRRLDPGRAEVTISPGLRALAREVDRALAERLARAAGLA
ncbi:unnamed protein product [Acidocella sp. C78]|uniref:nicotinate phosphoribosyltransferase n=1 Tax=Acidocella sp. C78 TaxID=1671486 RepID=UPI00191B915E|nr:nicotinate phosphoribosyltransferase [Acidocella sp. C78]CAG4913996.1 unnamed protein product [Acidocella sp. C78]